MTAKGGAYKKGLNREILKTGWSQLIQMLEYKADEVIRVDPKYTSQTCFHCGHREKENRKSQSSFKCVACNYSDNADANAALNILDRGYELTAPGTGAAGRRGVLGLPSPKTRQEIHSSRVEAGV